MNRGLLAQLGNAESIRDEYRTQRDGLERQSIDLQRRNIDLNDRVNELTAHMSVLVEQKRQYEQQLNVLRDENKRLARAARSPALGETLEAPSGAAMTTVWPASPVSVSPIRGRILSVDGDVVSGHFVRDDGFVFIIFTWRDDRFDLPYPDARSGPCCGVLCDGQFKCFFVINSQANSMASFLK